MEGLDQISFQLGEIRGLLANVEKNTADIKTEIKSVSGRVTTIEGNKKFQDGVDSQNKKIAGIVGTIAGFIGGGLITWIGRIFQ